MSEYNNPIEFSDHVLGAIDHKRDLSINEFKKKDLNNYTNLENLYIWYKELAQSIILNPPTTHVKTIYIEEKDDHVISVKYEYSEEKIVLEEISFVINF